MKRSFSIVQKLCFCLILASTLAGCGEIKRDTAAVSVTSSASQSSAVDYYLLGLRQIKAQNLVAAEATLDEMEVNYPLNLETGELYARLIEGLYKAGHQDQLISIADRFIQLFPSHKDIAYAHYYTGMVDYERGRQYMSIDASKRDPAYAKSALARFYTMLECCDNNKLTFKTKQHIYHLESMLSLHELRSLEVDYDAGRIDLAAQRGMSLIEAYPSSVAAKRAKILLSSKAFNDYRAGIDKAAAVALPVSVEKLQLSAKSEQKIGAYAVYLASSKDPQELKAKMAALGLADEVDYYKKSESGKSYFFASYGKFTSKAEAKQTKLALRVRTEIPDLWVRNIENSEYVENIDSEVAILPDFYAIQMMSFSTFEQLKAAVESMELANNVGMYSQVVKGDTSYIALYGDYPGWSAGKIGLAELQQRTGKTDYWLRKIESSKLKLRAIALPVVSKAVVKASSPKPVSVLAVVAMPVVQAAQSAPQPKAAAVEKFYAVQLMSFAKLEQLKSVVASAGLTDDVALYSHVVKGKTYFIALYGHYPAWAAGKQGLAELEQRTGKTGYWLRKIDSSKVKAVD